MTNGLAFTVRFGTNEQLYTGTLGAGVFGSTNLGHTWSPSNNGLSTPSVYSLTSTSDGFIFAGTDGGGIYRSTDLGTNWIQVNNGLSSFRIYSLTSNPQRMVFAGTLGTGVFRSTDGGLLWERMNNGLVSAFIYAVAASNTGEVFAGTPSAGIYRSTNNGNSWTQTNSGLTNLNINAIAISPDGYVYAGTEGSGVFRSVEPITSIASNEPFPQHMRLEQNFPNPFNPMTTISFQLTGNSFVSLRVFDVLGKNIVTLVNGPKPTGKHSVPWNADNIPSGIYFYRFSSGHFSETKKLVLVK